MWVQTKEKITNELVGKCIRFSNGVAVEVTAVGETNILAVNISAISNDYYCYFRGTTEYSFAKPVLYDVWKPEQKKKLVAPALMRRFRAESYHGEKYSNTIKNWMLSSTLFSSLEEAIKKSNPEYEIHWPAIPNKDGFYEVPE